MIYAKTVISTKGREFSSKFSWSSNSFLELGSQDAPLFACLHIVLLLYNSMGSFQTYSKTNSLRWEALCLLLLLLGLLLLGLHILGLLLVDLLLLSLFLLVLLHLASCLASFSASSSAYSYSLASSSASCPSSSFIYFDLNSGIYTYLFSTNSTSLNYSTKPHSTLLNYI